MASQQDPVWNQSYLEDEAANKVHTKEQLEELKEHQQKEEDTRTISQLEARVISLEERVKNNAQTHSVLVDEARADRDRHEQAANSRKGQNERLTGNLAEARERISELESNSEKAEREIQRLCRDLSTEKQRKESAQAELRVKGLEVIQLTEKLQNPSPAICTSHTDYDDLKSESSRMKEELQRERELKDVMGAKVQILEQYLVEEKTKTGEALRLLEGEKQAHERLKTAHGNVTRLPLSPGEDGGLRAVNQSNEGKRRKVDEGVTGLSNSNDTREWRDHIKYMVSILQDIRPTQKLDMHLVWYEISRSMGEKEEFVQNFLVYKEQQIKDKVLWQCLYEICHQGPQRAAKMTDSKPACRTCKNHVEFCTQVRESGGKLYFRTEKQ
jgi:chromosome segregation ATPase